MFSRRNNSWTTDWTLYVIPAANPDGLLAGYTHCGPGRANVGNSIDMNRCFETNFGKKTSRRNRTGGSPCLASEAASLKELLLQISSSHTIHLLDIHGWLNETYGDYSLHVPFYNQLNDITGYYDYDPDLGTGYLSAYAKTLNENAKAALIELPMPANPSDIINKNYAARVTNAIRSILGDNEE